MAKLDISTEARTYLQERDCALTVRLRRGQAGCCAMLTPVVEARKPADATGYKVITDGDIALYLQDGIEILPTGATISLTKLLWLTKPDVRGLNILP